MSQADELLNSLTENDISLQLTDTETEPHIVIGGDRVISVPKELQRIAVQYDHDVETVTFDCPRYWDDLDMSQLAIYINYSRKDRMVGCYKATNITVDENDQTIMHFDWTISRNVSEVKGELKFLVCIRKADDEGNEVNHWNSELNTEMYISEGLETGEEVVESYPDVISQWEQEVQDVKDILLAARDNGEFNGATFIPSVDDDGNLSWTNDGGFDNPETVNIHGYSPAILVREIDSGNELIITDYRGSQTITILDGYSPVILVREIEGGRELVITDKKQSQTVQILDGADGTDGQDGADGYSPAILVRDVDGGHELIITDYRGSQTVAVMDGVNGKDGNDGTDGTDGYSPTVVAEAVDGGTKITITDKDGAKTFTILNGTDGVNGIDGYSPTVATEALTGGTKVVITDKDGAKTFTVPNGVNGVDGQDGADGTDGVSPTIAVSDINGGHRVMITDVNGTQTFDVMDGTQEISEAVKEYIGTYMYVGETEPTSGPVLWFDTSETGVN